MQIWELAAIAVGLSMDAFAVAVCKGLSTGQVGRKECGVAGLYFGGFQAGMPLLGYLLGSRFRVWIESVDHWIAFILLAGIGLNMIRESRGEAEKVDASLSVKAMVPLAIATSIDALAVGISFAFLNVQIVPAVILIGITTFVLSAAGVKLGNAFGIRYKAKAELLGGVVLMFMGLKILLEHLGIWG